MKYITVLDFEAGRVFQYEVYLDQNEEIVSIYDAHEEYLTDKGHNLSNCEWMVHSNDKIITK